MFCAQNPDLKLFDAWSGDDSHDRCGKPTLDSDELRNSTFASGHQPHLAEDLLRDFPHPRTLHFTLGSWLAAWIGLVRVDIVRCASATWPFASMHSYVRRWVVWTIVLSVHNCRRRPLSKQHPQPRCNHSQLPVQVRCITYNSNAAPPRLFPAPTSLSLYFFRSQLLPAPTLPAPIFSAPISFSPNFFQPRFLPPPISLHWSPTFSNSPTLRNLIATPNLTTKRLTTQGLCTRSRRKIHVAHCCSQPCVPWTGRGSAGLTELACFCCRCTRQVWRRLDGCGGVGNCCA